MNTSHIREDPLTSLKSVLVKKHFLLFTEQSRDSRAVELKILIFSGIESHKQNARHVYRVVVLTQQL